MYEIFPWLDYRKKVLATAPANLIAYWPMDEFNNTQARSIAPIPSNHILNPGFETAGGGGADVFANWAETAGDGAIARTTTAGEFNGGAAAAKLTAGATANTVIQETIASGIHPGQTYRLQFYARGDGTYAGRYLVYDVTNSANIIAATSTGITGTGYALVQTSFGVASNCTSIRLDLMCPSTNTGIAYFDDVSLRAPCHGSYTGVTLRDYGSPLRGSGLFPYFDGAADYNNIYSQGLVNSFNGAEGTVAIWAKVSTAGIWTDGLAHRILTLYVDANNYCRLSKSTTNNQIFFEYDAGGTLVTVADTTHADQCWHHIAMTVSDSGNVMRAFIDGRQTGVDQATAGIWAGSLLNVGSVIGAGNTTPVTVWSGWFQHAALWSIPLNPNQVFHLARP